MDILTVTVGLIVHQVNMKGVMGAGLALQIKNKWPNVYTEYMHRLKTKAKLGDVQICTVDAELYVANVFGQDKFGPSGQFTDYNALHVAFGKIALWQDMTEYPVWIPYKMGCGMGGGDWGVVREIINRYLPDAEIVKL